jgi:hypothetical protein
LGWVNRWLIGRPADDLALDANTAMNLIPTELDKLAVAELEHRAVRDRSDLAAKPGHDDRHEAFVETRGVLVIPKRVTRRATMRMNLTDELLVAAPQTAQQPLRLGIGHDDTPALWVVIEAVERPDDQLAVGDHATDVDECL